MVRSVHLTALCRHSLCGLDVQVDIISSNTHSVGICVSAWIHQHTQEMCVLHERA